MEMQLDLLIMFKLLPSTSSDGDKKLRSLETKARL
jgi:hypothetical protein